VTDQTSTDFDGCNSECRRAGTHTLRWGGCEHAPEPEPTVSMSAVYTDPSDGYPAIGFDTYTAAQLAELIEPSLTSAGPGWPIPLDAVTARATALRIAGAIVHRHDEQRPATPVSSPPPDQTDQCSCRTHPTLTAQIGYPVRCPHCPPTAGPIPPTHWTKHVQRHHPEAASAVRPPAADRGAVYRELADQQTQLAVADDLARRRDAAAARRQLVKELRRLAAEAPQQVPGPGADLIEDYLRVLRGQGPEPDLSSLPPEQREAAAGQSEIVRALAGRDPELPPLDRDPVARRLGLHATAAEAQQPDAEARQAATEATESSTGHPPGCWYDAEAAEHAMLEERPEGQRTRARAVEAEKHDYIDAVECAIGLTVDCGGTPGVHRVRDAVLAVRDREMNRLRAEVGRLGDWCRTVSDHATTTAAERDRYHDELAVNEKDRVATLQRATQYADLLTQAHQIISMQKDLIGAERRIVATALEHRDQEHVKATTCPGCGRDHLTPPSAKPSTHTPPSATKPRPSATSPNTPSTPTTSPAGAPPSTPPTTQEQ